MTELMKGILKQVANKIPRILSYITFLPNIYLIYKLKYLLFKPGVL